MDTSRFHTMLGFAARARGLVSGETGCIQAITRRKALLVVMATDTGPNTRDRLVGRCRSAGARLVEVSTAEELGRAVGKDHRVCMAITDAQFVRPILEALGEISGM